MRLQRETIMWINDRVKHVIWKNYYYFYYFHMMPRSHWTDSMLVILIFEDNYFNVSRTIFWKTLKLWSDWLMDWSVKRPFKCLTVPSNCQPAFTQLFLSSAINNCRRARVFSSPSCSCKRRPPSFSSGAFCGRGGGRGDARPVGSLGARATPDSIYWDLRVFFPPPPLLLLVCCYFSIISTIRNGALHKSVARSRGGTKRWILGTGFFMAHLVIDIASG